MSAQTIGNKTISFESNSNDGEWALYHPGTDINFNQDGASFENRNFENITGLGLIVDKDDFSNARHWLGLLEFKVRAHVGEGTANIAPEISMKAAPVQGRAPLEVNFDASASFDPDGSVASYAWDFGNGNTGFGEDTAYTYHAPGNYLASLTITDQDGGSAVDFVEIEVLPENMPPVAAIYADRISAEIPATMLFDAIGSYDSLGTIVAYDWNFGDGTKTSGLIVEHTYTRAGIYNVQLVRNRFGWRNRQGHFSYTCHHQWFNTTSSKYSCHTSFWGASINSAF
ncbi:MAG: PKD domain-containing protein [Bacteroidales bacterium]|nr:PKD domain-containing protein [Bacteroidales bacterium]